MQKISDIVSVKQFDKYQNNTNVAAIDEEKTKKVLNRLFTRFERIFPKFWVNIKSQEHLNGIKDEWFECFQRARLTNLDQILAGIARAQESKLEYLPKASAFIDWCTNTDPESLGFPAHQEAYYHSVKMNIQFSDHKHPDERVDKVIRHTIQQIGKFEYRTMNDTKARQAFERYYSIAVRDFINGNLKDIAKMLEDNSEETQEIKRQDDLIKPEFKEVKNHRAAMDAIRGMGINVKRTDERGLQENPV